MARTAMLLALVVAVASIYVVWQGQVAALVSDVVANQRDRLVGIATASSLRSTAATPAPVLLNEFVLNSEQMFLGLTPLFLFAGPAVLVLFRRQPIVWLIVVSTAVYLMVMNVPLLAVPYIYLTYFEVLFTPVRNVIFFVYLFAGALVYATVIAIVPCGSHATADNRRRRGRPVGWRCSWRSRSTRRRAVSSCR